MKRDTKEKVQEVLGQVKKDLLSMKIIVDDQSVDWRNGHSQGVKNSVTVIDNYIETFSEFEPPKEA